MFDGAKKIALIRIVEMGVPRRKLYRAVTWAERSEDRVLLGYFSGFALCVHVVWGEWIKLNPPTSRRP